MDYSLLPDAFREDVNCTNMYQEEPIKELSVMHWAIGDGNWPKKNQNNGIQEHLTPLLNNPSFAPLMQSNLSDLPPALVITCEFDILRDEGVIYAQRLKNSGVRKSYANHTLIVNLHNWNNSSQVPTKWVHLEHGFHGMLCIQSKLDVARVVSIYSCSLLISVFSASAWRYQELDDGIVAWSRVKNFHVRNNFGLWLYR